MSRKNKKKHINLNNPHDLLVKASLSKAGAIQEFAKAYFPADVLKEIDLVSLHLTGNSYVTDELKQLHTDLVFSFKMRGKRGYAYTILEHQSTPDRLMPLRFVKYNLALLEEVMKGKDEKEPLPLIVNICLYHYKNDKPYPYSTSVYDLFRDSYLAEKLGIFTKFHLVDLNSIPNKILEGHKQIHLMEKLLKYSRHRDAFNVLKEELAIADIDMLLEGDYWKVLVIYTSQVIGKMEGISEEEFVSLFKEKLNKTEEEIMQTIAQSITQAYAEKYLAPKYIQEGMQAGKLTIAKNLLRLNLDVKLIQEATGLTQEIIEALRQE
jgi:predicted transposase/invertase (TIGR01784 family)